MNPDSFAVAANLAATRLLGAKLEHEVVVLCTGCHDEFDPTWSWSCRRAPDDAHCQACAATGAYADGLVFVVRPRVAI